MSLNAAVLCGGEGTVGLSALSTASTNSCALQGDGEVVDTSTGFENIENDPAAGNGAGSTGTADDPVLDIEINNVVSSFSTRCHLNLKRIATEGSNVEFKRANGMVNMRMRSPNVTASIWSSGKITVVGATSEDLAKIACRRIARQLQNLGFRVRFTNFRVVNVLGTCTMPFAIRLNHFTQNNHQHASYEPELHPAVTYRIKDPKATLKVFSTGSITVTAPCVANVQNAIEHIFPLVYPFKMPKTEKTLQREHMKAMQKQYKQETYKRAKISYDMDSEEEDSLDSEESSSEFDSDQSQD